MEHRDRATGWKHAKLSGHKNEDLVKQLLDTHPDYAQSFLERIGHPHDHIIGTSVGGLHETDVYSVNSGKTKSKTDLKVYLSNGETVNISIKKSLNGQVYFVRAGLFIETFEKQFCRRIPDSVKRAIELFWAAAPDSLEIIEQYADRSNPRNYALQMKHHSLNATTLNAYDPTLYTDLINWFIQNAYEIAELCFSMGAVRDSEEWSDYIWYINMLGEVEIDALYSIPQICRLVQKSAEEETYYSTTNGGTTIQLPFGFVQWHQEQLQFHHKFDKVNYLAASFGR